MSIAGTWRNEYGSLMTLSAGDGAAPTALRGHYQSSTGSVGRYAVTGFTAAHAAPAGQGQPVALSICWHSLGDEAPDPSWHWASGLSGQLSVLDGEEVLTLSHLLVAPGEFPDLMPAGQYIDKLCYRRCPDPRSGPALAWPASPDMVMGHPLGSDWHGPDGSVLRLAARQFPGTDFTEASGVLCAGECDTPVAGFIAARNAAVPSLYAISLALAGPGTGWASSLSGVLDAARGTLRLFGLSSRPTSPGERYAQTSASLVEYCQLSKTPSCPLPRSL